MSLLSKAQQFFPGGVNSPVRNFSAVGGTSLFVNKAKGAYIYLKKKGKVCDYILSWGAVILGHSQAELIKEIQKQSKLGLSYGLNSKKELLLAEKILQDFPSFNKIRFVNSGTEATMTALRLARAATNKEKIIKFNGCYHGHSESLLVKAGSGASTFGESNSLGVLNDFTKHTLSIPFNDHKVLEQSFKEHGNNIAGVILEPVAGNMGVIIPKQTFLTQLRQYCNDYQSILIFDEIMCGYRMPAKTATKHFNINPDLVCLGKIIGGGLAIGAILGKNLLMDLLSPVGKVYQAGTFSSNPLAMAAGLKTLQLYEKLKANEKINELNSYLTEKITPIISKSSKVNFSSIGAMFSVFFNLEKPENFATVLKSDTKLFAKFFQFMLANGVLIPPSQFEANFLSIAHQQEEIDLYCHLLNKFLNEENLWG